MSHTENAQHRAVPQKSFKTYYPLILILTFIIGGALYLESIISPQGTFSTHVWMQSFMGLFFCVFAFFKLLDVPAFATGYKRYDIVTKQFPVWGYIYPFVELGFGILYLENIQPFWTNIAVIIVLGISIIGVIQSVVNKKKIHCVCLGTGFNLPMSQVTIIEDATMILMAIFMIL